MKLVLGLILVIVSFSILTATYFPLLKNEIDYQLIQFKEETLEETKPLSSEFGIVIDSLGINSKVIKDVDPFDANVYQNALTQGVAHAKGTDLPEEDGGNTFIFSHSSENFYEASRYNSVFYLLPKLNMGDLIIVYFENIRYDYHVTEKKIVEPEEIDYLSDKSDKSQLTLMTCYPPGTNLKRFIVVAN